jgi:hypothetical protein
MSSCLSRIWSSIILIILIGCDSDDSIQKFTVLQAAGPLLLTSGATNDAFALVAGGVAAPIVVDVRDHKGVERAAKDLSNDIRKVSAVETQVVTTVPANEGHIVVAGTIGSNALIDSLVQQKKLDVEGIKGHWESFVIQVVDQPLPQVKSALVIAGSDRRGTTYGIYELSAKIGISPWNFWADVNPDHKTELYFTSGIHKQKEPSVKYRGIFINDEYNLKNWSHNQIEKDKYIGPETYKKVFELLLRLKANYLWPAMHHYTDHFNKYPENAKNADLYGIVIGSSHCEMLLRNNVKEWDDWAATHPNADGSAPVYDYSVNPKTIYDYWSFRAKTHASYENVYSIGMRGIHDSGMPCQKCSSRNEKVALLQKVIEDQRDILRTQVSKDLSKVLQVYTPYREALDLYNAGLEVPDDVTLLWPEDNQGYIRQLPTPQEKLRSGGSGVYYHISVWGPPKSYLWLNSTPLTLVQEEMKKAYDNGSNRIWIVNVGDIKPAEIGMEFFLTLALDIHRYSHQNVTLFAEEMAARDFGTPHAKEIAALVMQYFQYNIARRPEFMAKDVYSLTSYGDEASLRLSAFEDLEKRATALYNRLPAHKKDAFYQLVLYSIKASHQQLEKYVFAAKADLAVALGKNQSAAVYRKKAEQAYATTLSDLDYYNNKLAGGKWKGIIYPFGGKVPAIERLPALPVVPPASPKAGLGVAVEGETQKEANHMLAFTNFDNSSRFVDIFNQGEGEFIWKAQTTVPWLKLSETQGMVAHEKRIYVGIDWSHHPDGVRTSEVILEGAGSKVSILVKTLKRPEPNIKEPGTYVESNGYVSMEAEHYSGLTAGNEVSWHRFPYLGRSGDSMKLLPDTASVLADLEKSAPELKYRIHFFSTGTFPVTIYRIPTLSTHGACRIAVALDEKTPEIVTGNNTSDNPKWSINVLENIEKLTTTITVNEAGVHTLRIRMVDPSIAIDKLVIDTGGLKPSYLGPPESMRW